MLEGSVRVTERVCFYDDKVDVTLYEKYKVLVGGGGQPKISSARLMVARVTHWRSMLCITFLLSRGSLLGAGR